MFFPKDAPNGLRSIGCNLNKSSVFFSLRYFGY